MTRHNTIMLKLSSITAEEERKIRVFDGFAQLQFCPASGDNGSTWIALLFVNPESGYDTPALQDIFPGFTVSIWPENTVLHVRVVPFTNLTPIELQYYQTRTAEDTKAAAPSPAQTAVLALPAPAETVSIWVPDVNLNPEVRIVRSSAGWKRRYLAYDCSQASSEETVDS